MRFGIQSVPTVIFFKGGQEVERFIGLRDIKDDPRADGEGYWVIGLRPGSSTDEDRRRRRSAQPYQGLTRGAARRLARR